MLRNYFFINLMLMVLIAVLGVKLVKVIAYTVDIPSESKVERTEKDGTVVEHKKSEIKEAYFEVISQKDLFRPSRSAPATVDRPTDVAESKEPPKLFGTVILDGSKSAILEDPGTKTTKLYGMNESVGGYVISDILEQKIVLLKDGEKVEVRLRDDKGIKPQQRVLRQPVVRRPQQRRPVRRTRPVPRRRTVQRNAIPPDVNSPQDTEDLMEQMEQMEMEQTDQPEDIEQEEQ